MAVAVLVDVTVVAAVTEVLHAQAKPMGYVIAENVEDQDAYTKDLLQLLGRPSQKPEVSFS
jgi:hypothetical protein